MLRWLVILIGFIGIAPLALTGCESGDGAELLCEPGENIFCRCRGGEPGTKRCAEDGAGFEQCFGDSGACDESDVPGSSGAGSDNPNGEPTGKPMLEACAQSSECQSGLCSMGYCTKPCATWTECTDEAAEIYGDCVNVGPLQQCAPYCGSQADCAEYGTLSSCGYVQAVDAVPVVVCADFGASTPLPPEGRECYDDFDCHLGFAGLQRVCEFGVCIGGCHENDDCPDELMCTPGAPGMCG